MNKLILFMLLTILISCGKIKVDAPKDFTVDFPNDFKVDINPNFKEAAEFCDNRYKDNPEAAEACFMDYREYFSIKVGVDLSSIISFCNENYTNALDNEECINDLTDLITSVLNRSNV
jgi:hypothetical protein